MADKKKGFIVYCDMLNHIESLNMKQRGLLLTAMLCDQSGLELPQMDGGTRVAFSFIKSGMDRDTEKYNRIVEKRREAGKKGGRPPKDEESKKKQKKANESKPKANESKPKANESNDEAKKPDNGERITDNGYQITDIGDKQEDIYGGKAASRAREKITRKSYGEFKHVLLSDPEYEKLVAKYGLEETEKAIAYFDAYIEEKRPKTKNHYLTMLRWVFDAVREQESRRAVKPEARPVNKAAQELDDFYNMVTDWVESKEEQNG